MFGGFLVWFLSFVLNNDAAVLRMVAFVAVMILLGLSLFFTAVLMKKL